jgi:hypothetical protein
LRIAGIVLVVFSLVSLRSSAENIADQSEIFELLQAYVEDLAKGNIEDLVAAGTDPFTFDGRVVKGRKNIGIFYQKIITRGDLDDQAEANIELFDYQAALKRFGEPPGKLSHLKLKRCMFAAVTYASRRGFLIVLTKTRKEGWRVTAVTD